MKKIKYMITTHEGQVEKEVEGYEVVRGLAIHRTGEWGNAWRVTHLPTGFSISRSPFDLRRQAVCYVEILVKKFPKVKWERLKTVSTVTRALVKAAGSGVKLRSITRDLYDKACRK